MKRILLIALCLANPLNASAALKKAQVTGELTKLVSPAGNSYSSPDSKQKQEKTVHASAIFKRIGDDLSIGYIDIMIKFFNHSLSKVGRSIDEKGMRSWIEGVDSKDYSKYPQELALLDAIIADCKARDARTFLCIPYQNEGDIERRYIIDHVGALHIISERSLKS